MGGKKKDPKLANGFSQPNIKRGKIGSFLVIKDSLAAEADDPSWMESASDWDVALNFLDLRKRGTSERELQRLRARSVSAILRKAIDLSLPFRRPEYPKQISFDQASDPTRFELDVDETLSSGVSINGIQNQNPLSALWGTEPNSIQVCAVIVVDTSLSMTGEKFALTALALASVLYEFASDPVSIVVFENEAKVLKQADEYCEPSRLIERFLEVPAKGYTHMEKGLQVALKEVRRIASKRSQVTPACILITDGKPTAGRDPEYLASHFDRLSVLRVGADGSGESLCRELAKKGNGKYFESSTYDSMPQALLTLMRDLLRGRAGF